MIDFRMVRPVVFGTFLLGASACVMGQDSLPTPDEKDNLLIGAWQATQSSDQSFPQIEILSQGETLEFQFWTRASTEAPFGPAKQLAILRPYEKSIADSADKLFAFGTYDSRSGSVHFLMKLSQGQLHVETVKIVNGSDTSHLLIHSVFEKSDGNDRKAEQEDDSDPTKADDSTTGVLIGKIDTGSTLRGVLSLSPQSDGIEPREGIEIGSARPQFRFSKVPKGKYALEFAGTIDGAERKLRWKELEVAEGQDGEESEELSISLILRDASME